MLAIVRDATKQVLPRYSATTGKNELTLMVVVDVDFVMDGSGAVHHRQKFARLPEEVDPADFQRQADAMQADLDQAAATATARAVAAEQNAVADHQIKNLLKSKYAREIGDRIALNDAGEMR